MNLVTNPFSIWLVGLSGAGKTTIGKALTSDLKEENIRTVYLDGDVIRNGLNKDLGFSETDRIENIRRVAEINKVLLECGISVINSFICPTNETRELAKTIIGKEHFCLFYVNTPLSTCIERDTKGLYVKARQGEIKDFTGISSKFEEPNNALEFLNTKKLTVDECIKIIKKSIIPAANRLV